jgi:predicted RecB family endonuclease
LQTAKTAREDARTARADAFKTLREQKKAARTELLQELTANVERIYKERVAKELASLRRSDPNMEDSERLKVAKMLAEAEAYRMKVVGADQIIVKVDEMFESASRAGGRPRGLRKPKAASKPKATSKPKSKKKLSTK